MLPLSRCVNFHSCDFRAVYIISAVGHCNIQMMLAVLKTLQHEIDLAHSSARNSIRDFLAAVKRVGHGRVLSAAGDGNSCSGEIHRERTASLRRGQRTLVILEAGHCVVIPLAGVIKHQISIVEAGDVGLRVLSRSYHEIVKPVAVIGREERRTASAKETSLCCVVAHLLAVYPALNVVVDRLYLQLHWRGGVRCALSAPEDIAVFPQAPVAALRELEPVAARSRMTLNVAQTNAGVIPRRIV